MRHRPAACGAATQIVGWLRPSRPVGAHGIVVRAHPSPLGWAEESRAVGPNGQLRQVAGALKRVQMEAEAASVGFYEHKLNRQEYPRLQLRTVKELMGGKGIERPSTVAATDETFKKAPQAKRKGHEQHEMEL